MRLVRWRYVCGGCGAEYWLPGADLSFAYGVLLGRTRSGRAAVLDTIDDATFEEIGALIAEDQRANGLTDSERIGLVRQAVEFVYDASETGERFVVEGSPGCVNCGGRTVADFAETDDEWSEAADVMTHAQWDRLPASRRAELIAEFLDQVINGA